MNNKITKAVIPCGGAGTRFHPITKSVPKDILPVIDTPGLSYIIKEAAASGITDVLLILGEGKEAIRNYFTPDRKLEDFLLSKGKTELYNDIKAINEGVNIVFEYQPKPLGSGDAILRAEKFTGNEPFCVALGDDIVYGDNPVMKQLADVYSDVQKPIIGVQRIETDDIVNYGVAKLDTSFSPSYNGRLHKCAGFFEKPPIDKIPSRLACLGRYILDKSIYDELRITKQGAGGELQLTDALDSICLKQGAYAYDFLGKRYDLGNKLESVKAIIEFALRRKEFKGKFEAYLTELVKSFK